MAPDHLLRDLANQLFEGGIVDRLTLLVEAGIQLTAVAVERNSDGLVFIRPAIIPRRLAFLVQHDDERVLHHLATLATKLLLEPSKFTLAPLGFHVGFAQEDEEEFRAANLVLEFLVEDAVAGQSLVIDKQGSLG